MLNNGGHLGIKLGNRCEACMQRYMFFYYKTTVSALAAIKEPMVESHYGGALNVGVTEKQLHEILMLIEQEVSFEAAEVGSQRLEHTLQARKEE